MLHLSFKEENSSLLSDRKMIVQNVQRHWFRRSLANFCHCLFHQQTFLPRSPNFSKTDANASEGSLQRILTGEFLSAQFLEPLNAVPTVTKRLYLYALHLLSSSRDEK